MKLTLRTTAIAACAFASVALFSPEADAARRVYIYGGHPYYTFTGLAWDAVRTYYLAAPGMASTPPPIPGRAGAPTPVKMASAARRAPRSRAATASFTGVSRSPPIFRRYFRQHRETAFGRSFS